jgi:hypothetical protein
VRHCYNCGGIKQFITECPYENKEDHGGPLIRPKRIYFLEHFRYCFSSNLCVLNTTNTD